MPLGFLSDAVSYEAEVYRDGPDKTALVIEKTRVKRGDVLTMPMLAAGGFAVRIRPAAP